MSIHTTEIVHSLADIYARWDNRIPSHDVPLLEDAVLEMVQPDMIPTNEKEFQKTIMKLNRRHAVQLSKNRLRVTYLNMRHHQPERLPPIDDKAHAILLECLIKKRGKSHSGIISITVLTSPYPKVGKKTQRFSCKWNCFFCPNEPGQPRSYLHDEPAVLRANRNQFDPIFQFHDRAGTLAMNGHPVDKIEILVLGGTWSSYPHAYQETFVRDLFYAANTFWDRATPHRRPKSLAEEQKINETAKSKIIGLTLETRPDCIDADEIRRLRRYGCTRVQLGVQHTNDDVLKLINRGHGIAASIEGIKRLMDCGFKVDMHLMFDLPGSSPRLDREMLNYVLKSDDLRADQLKLYPHAVVPWTVTKTWLENGKFKPMSDEDLQENLIAFKSRVHPWIRLNRVIRDIPDHYISGGNAKTNLRQDLLKIMASRGLHCDCIRCREVKLDRSKIKDAELVIRRYGAGGQLDYFISFETPDRRTIFGFVRLRISDMAGRVKRWGQGERGYTAAFGTEYVRVDGKITRIRDQTTGKKSGARKRRRREKSPGPSRQQRGSSHVVVFPELLGCAMVRELHVYGKLQVAGRKRNRTSTTTTTKSSFVLEEAQHVGFGRRLMRAAERVARLHGKRRVSVIAGVGTRAYYEKLGYKKDVRGGEFMIRTLRSSYCDQVLRPWRRVHFLWSELDADRTDMSKMEVYGREWTLEAAVISVLIAAAVTALCAYAEVSL